MPGFSCKFTLLRILPLGNCMGIHFVISVSSGVSAMMILVFAVALPLNVASSMLLSGMKPTMQPLTIAGFAVPVKAASAWATVITSPVSSSTSADASPSLIVIDLISQVLAFSVVDVYLKAVYMLFLPRNCSGMFTVASPNVKLLEPTAP